MKTGIELIMEERRSQIEKHGFTKEHDSQYKNGQLFKAAKAVWSSDFFWPKDWDRKWYNKIMSKNRVGQLAVAGALLLADEEITPKRSFLRDEMIREIAAEIDRLNHQKP